MDNNLPNDPSNQKKSNGNPVPPPFGSNFNPNSNPVDPNNPYPSAPQSPPPIPNPSPPSQPHPKPHGHVLSEEEKHHLSELMKQRLRDGHGQLLPNELPKSRMPPIVEVNQNVQPSEKEDPPLINFSITNPVTYLKLFLKRLLKRQAITLRIPVLAIIIIMAGIGGFGIGFQSGMNWALARLFPNYSPILHRPITEQGTIQKSNKGEYFLKSDDKKKSLWTIKSISANVNLEDYVNQQIQITGNLTPTPNLIEVTEVISFEAQPADDASSSESSPTSSPSSTTDAAVSNASPGTAVSSSLPALYPNLKWEIPKSKTLTFTSGKRKVEQEVIYIESLPVNTYPQDFVSYYTQQLTNSGFKQTLNSQEPDSLAITYSKGNLFLTFGVKNLYSGTGDTKQLVGYKAYIEHN